MTAPATRTEVLAYLNTLTACHFERPNLLPTTVLLCPACGTLFFVTDDGPDDGLYPDKMVWQHGDECDGCAEITDHRYTDPTP